MPLGMFQHITTEHAWMLLVFYLQHTPARIQDKIRNLAEVSHWCFSPLLLPSPTPSSFVEAAAELIRRQLDSVFQPASALVICPRLGISLKLQALQRACGVIATTTLWAFKQLYAAMERTSVERWIKRLKSGWCVVHRNLTIHEQHANHE